MTRAAPRRPRLIILRCHVNPPLSKANAHNLFYTSLDTATGKPPLLPPMTAAAGCSLVLESRSVLILTSVTTPHYSKTTDSFVATQSIHSLRRYLYSPLGNALAHLRAARVSLAGNLDHTTHHCRQRSF